MMTDREMLELAAKAAGIEHLDRYATNEGLLLGDYMENKLWNPLTDDGDRYRLARALHFYLDFRQGIVYGPDKQMLGVWSPGNKNDEARAIVLAASCFANKAMGDE